MTVATAQGLSSDKERCVEYFLFLKILLIILLDLKDILIIGLPFLLFITSTSLCNNPLEKPVPRAFTKASLAANLFA